MGMCWPNKGRASQPQPLDSLRGTDCELSIECGRHLHTSTSDYLSKNGRGLIKSHENVDAVVVVIAVGSTYIEIGLESEL